MVKGKYMAITNDFLVNFGQPAFRRFIQIVRRKEE